MIMIMIIIIINIYCCGANAPAPWESPNSLLYLNATNQNVVAHHCDQFIMARAGVRHPNSYSDPIPSPILLWRRYAIHHEYHQNLYSIPRGHQFIVSHSCDNQILIISHLIATVKHLWIAPALPSEIIIMNTPINSQHVETVTNIMK
jgi:hypothetical protein